MDTPDCVEYAATDISSAIGEVMSRELIHRCCCSAVNVMMTDPADETSFADLSSFLHLEQFNFETKWLSDNRGVGSVVLSSDEIVNSTDFDFLAVDGDRRVDVELENGTGGL